MEGHDTQREIVKFQLGLVKKMEIIFIYLVWWTDEHINIDKQLKVAH